MRFRGLPFLVVVAGGLGLLAAAVLRGGGVQPVVSRPERSGPAPHSFSLSPPEPSATPPSRQVDPAEPGGAEDRRQSGVPGTEKWHYIRFLRSTDARRPEILADAESPLPGKVALLRAEYELRGANALPLFRRAIAGEGIPASHSEALRGFAGRFLTEQARSDRPAWSLLSETVFGTPSIGEDQRERAARAVFSHAEEKNVPGLVSKLLGVSDEATLEGSIRGLARNGTGEAGRNLQWLAGSHPRGFVRDLARRELDGEAEPGDSDE